MKEKKELRILMFQKLREKASRFPVSPGIFTATLIVYYEFLFQLWMMQPLSGKGFLIPLFFALFTGGILGIVTELIPRKAAGWVVAALGILMTTCYLLEYFLYDTYHMFMTPAMIFHGAKGVATDYADLVVTAVTRSFWRIAIMVLPPVLFGLFASMPERSKKHQLFALSLAAIGGIGAVSATAIQFGSLNQLGKSHDLESGIRTLGIPAALVQNLSSDASGGEEVLELEEVSYVLETQPPVQKEEVEAETPVVYEPNVLPLDFEALAQKGNLKELHGYIAAQKPTMKNEYTGLFAGKNLILITAEAFTKEVIDPERTPTLYRLATKGIEFTDYYQPAWGGSTTGGEMSNLFGLVPDCSGGMGQISGQKPFITIGSRLSELGYFSAAYHNNTGTFYNRNSTHINLGYDQFITPDQGMEVKGQWPQSDLEMIDWTVPRFIDHQPFSIYYMTVSGHSVYDVSSNHMSAKNYAAVADLPYSEPVKCYLAANQELESAMASLMTQLEAAGIADDTVIVIATDHYPYGLDVSHTWGNNKNCVAELFGISDKEYNQFTRDHSALIIWSGSIEDQNIRVDTPTYSLDILPTLCNLFGVEYESRLLVGRDVFSDAAPLVLWPNKCWITEKGRFDNLTETFYPNEGVTVEEGYVKQISAIVKNKVNFSYAVQRQNYLQSLRKLLNEASAAEGTP